MKAKGTMGHRPDLREVTETAQGVFLQLTVGMIGQAQLCQSVLNRRLRVPQSWRHAQAPEPKRHFLFVIGSGSSLRN